MDVLPCWPMRVWSCQISSAFLIPSSNKRAWMPSQPTTCFWAVAGDLCGGSCCFPAEMKCWMDRQNPNTNTFFPYLSLHITQFFLLLENILWTTGFWARHWHECVDVEYGATGRLLWHRWDFWWWTCRIRMDKGCGVHDTSAHHQLQICEVLWSLGDPANLSARSWLWTSNIGKRWRFGDGLPSRRRGHFDPQNSGIEARAFGHDCFWWGHHASRCMQCSSFSFHSVQHVLVSRHA